MVQIKESNTSIEMAPKYIKISEAMTLLGLSRHKFNKSVEKGYVVQHKVNDKNVYDKTEIKEFAFSPMCQKLREGNYDKRNKLNDLSGKEWISETKSYFFQKGLGINHPEAKIEKLHPAPFSFQDIEKLILFFTKQNMVVLDPFGGVGSTAKACERTKRKCISIELSKKYHNLSIKRLETETGKGSSQNHQFINADSCEYLSKLDAESVDFVVTSPPYWGILHKQDQKVKKNRVANHLDTIYSEDSHDLGNISDYDIFLHLLCNKIFLPCARALRMGKYMAIIVSDFREKGEFVSFHSDIIHHLNKKKIHDGGTLVLQGIKILIQNHKSLLPYGYPFSYVENIHHQYIIIFQKK